MLHPRHIFPLYALRSSECISSANGVVVLASNPVLEVGSWQKLKHRSYYLWSTLDSGGQAVVAIHVEIQKPPLLLSAVYMLYYGVNPLPPSMREKESTVVIFCYLIYVELQEQTVVNIHEKKWSAAVIINVF